MFGKLLKNDDHDPIPEPDELDQLLHRILVDRSHPLRDDIKKWLKRKLKSIEKAKEDAEKLNV